MEMIFGTRLRRPTNETGALPGSLVEGRLLMQLLDQIEHGMLLVDADGRLRYGNELGRLELGGDGPLRLQDGCIGAVDHAHQCQLDRALYAASHGRRQLLTFDRPGPSHSIAFTPLCDGRESELQQALLVFGKRRDDSHLALDFYARSRGLTGAEATVLGHLAGGLEPQDIARNNAVAISTIRSQIASIRSKTGAGSIRELLDQIALLPPIRNALRPTATSRFAAPTVPAMLGLHVVKAPRPAAPAVRAA